MAAGDITAVQFSKGQILRQAGAPLSPGPASAPGTTITLAGQLGNLLTTKN